MSALKASLDAVRAREGDSAKAAKPAAKKPAQARAQTRGQETGRGRQSEKSAGLAERRQALVGAAPSRGKQGRLEGYRAKRDFAATPEPAPGTARGRRRRSRGS